MRGRGADALPAGVVRVRSGVIAHANDWFAEWFGTSAEKMVGRSVDELLIHAPGDLLPAGVGPGPWMMVHAREPDRAVMVSRHRHADEDVLVIEEASKRFHALTDLRRRYALADRTRTRLQLVMDSSIAFSSASTEERLAEILADTTVQAYRAETSTVYLLEPGGSRVVTAGAETLGDRIDA